MALKAHNSVKLGVRPSFSFIKPNSSAVSRSCSAVFTVISIYYKKAQKYEPPANKSAGNALFGNMAHFPHSTNVGPSDKGPPALSDKISTFATYGGKPKHCLCSKHQLEHL